MPGVLRIRRSRRLAAVVGGAGLLVAACAPASEPPTRPIQSGDDFVTSVVDSLFDAGRSAAVVLDQDGNSAVAYLLYQPTPSEDALPPAVIPGDPQPPAVMFATRTGGTWSRTSVTPQKTSPAEGDAPEIATGDKQAKPGVDVDLAVDGQGTYHVVWSTPDGVFSSSGGAGSFSEREQVDFVGLGASIALAQNGTPSVAYYKGRSLVVATKAGDSWEKEVAATVTTCDDCPPVRTAIAFGPDGPMVAYTDGSSPMLTRQGAVGWSVESIEGDGGGFGMAIDTDGDGNPHVAYYAAGGEVHHAHAIGGSTWEVSTVGGGPPGPTTPAAAPSAGASPATPTDPRSWWSAGIGLDDQGTHHVVFADPVTGQVLLASNQSGQFDAAPVNGGQDGANPSVAVAGDGRLAVAWYDTQSGNLDVGTSASGELPVAFSPAPTETPSVGPPAAECEPEGTELAIVALNLQFDKNCLAVEAGQAFTIAFDNQDSGIPHNVEIYAEDPLSNPQAQELFVPGNHDPLQGPAQTTYEVDPIEDPGSLLFRCFFHPTSMIGTFVVAEGGGAGG